MNDVESDWDSIKKVCYLGIREFQKSLYFQKKTKGTKEEEPDKKDEKKRREEGRRWREEGGKEGRVIPRFANQD